MQPVSYEHVFFITIAMSSNQDVQQSGKSDSRRQSGPLSINDSISQPSLFSSPKPAATETDLEVRKMQLEIVKEHTKQYGMLTNAFVAALVEYLLTRFF